MHYALIGVRHILCESTSPQSMTAMRNPFPDRPYFRSLEHLEIKDLMPTCCIHHCYNPANHHGKFCHLRQTVCASVTLVCSTITFNSHVLKARCKLALFSNMSWVYIWSACIVQQYVMLCWLIIVFLCEEINLCLPNPCKNGATCTERTGGRYECTCPIGYKGVTCEGILYIFLIVPLCRVLWEKGRCKEYF